MSSDLYFFDASFHRHSSSDIVSSDGGEDLLFSSESFPFPFPFLTTPPIDVSQEISNHQTQQNPLNETPSLDSLSPSFFNFSPPSSHLESLSRYQANHAVPQPLSNGPNLESEFGKFSVLDELELKSEECQMGVDYNYSHQFAPHSYSGAGNISKFMQRSFSSESFGGKAGFFCQPHYETVMDSPNFQSQSLSSGENSFFSGQMRRVCSTGDLQNMKEINRSHMDGSFLEEANFKVGRYSAEERKERISKYRAKRSQRNFNKTIKYACRKTLADNRPRIRGRFARNDETGETHKAPCSSRDEDEDEFWIEGLHEHEEQDQDITVGAEEYVNSYGGPDQFQYYGY
ncbi:hypothetical protein L6164_028253 [Bauhinia variegata]|uniref:Uncharacterized protein n=1 Tax=Bauhinia variegata TaxID=167791 RepID=A0ACB9LVD9_BAUVA|nr:hypothetical protein L6164_028253 [Bauhinia variegata]